MNRNNDEKSSSNEMRGEGCNQVYKRLLEGNALYPLHDVEIDSMQLDRYVVDDETGCSIGRPWVSIAVDSNSKVIWAIDISNNTPSVNTIRRLLRHGIFPKHVGEDYDTRNDWEVFGIPNRITIYGPLNLKGTELERLIAGGLQSQIKYKPKVSRRGRSIEKIFSNIGSLLNKDSEAMLTLKDITKLLTIYVTDTYHFQAQSSLPPATNNPISWYRECIKAVGVTKPVDKCEANYLKIELLETGIVTKTYDGIIFKDKLYKSEVFSEIIDEEQILHKVKFDRNNV